MLGRYAGADEHDHISERARLACEQVAEVLSMLNHCLAGLDHVVGGALVAPAENGAHARQAVAASVEQGGSDVARFRKLLAALAALHVGGGDGKALGDA